MRGILPFGLVAVAAIFTSSAQAQNDRFAYAITDLTQEGAGWNALRKIDLKTGEYSDVLLNGIDQNATVFDATTKKPLVLQADARFGNLMQMPFGSGVAAAAYDKKHNRLYYTPMFIDQLRYIDLRSMKVYYLNDQSFTRQGHLHNDEGKIITRMVIAPDGTGYAISNDGQNFIRFTTGKNSVIENLGALVDDPENNGISIHNRCTSFGGDMIADDKGNLYIVSARNHVFRVSTETRVATLVGTIQGLPANFTTNGVAVDHEGMLLLSSAVDANNYYRVDPANWSATTFEAAKGIFRSSDLANSNYLAYNRSTPQDVPLLTSAGEKFANLISVYPNPVTHNRITLQFSRVPAGDYMIDLTDMLGRSVQQVRITINAEDQTQVLNIREGDARGIYLVKVFDSNRQSVFTQKVVVQ